jgi:hypothetical protein
VRFNKREWIAEEFCWRCGRPYDEARTPTYAAELDRAVEEATKVHKKDRAAFERDVLEAGRRFEQAWEAEKVMLRENAKSDAKAARILRGRLETELKGLLKTQKTLRHEIENNPGARELLQNVERQLRAVESELASIQATLPILMRSS